MEANLPGHHHDHQEKGNFLSLEDLDSKVSINGWAVIFFIGYLILGILYYCYSDQQRTALDAVYLSVITFTTVGYGMFVVITLSLFSFLFNRRYPYRK